MPAASARVARWATAIACCALPLTALGSPARAVPRSLARAPAPAVSGVSRGVPAAGRPIPPPVHRGRLRITGQLRDGGRVSAAGLSWRPPRLPAGMRLLTFEVGYVWQRCSARGDHCVKAADTTATPFAASRYLVGHGDTGGHLKLTETAAEVVETSPATFSTTVVRRSASHLAGTAVRAYRRHTRPRAEFVNGTPEPRTASREEYFQAGAPHYNRHDGRPGQRYRVDHGGWRALPASRLFYTGHLAPGRHQVEVRTANRAGSSVIRFGWRVVPMPAPVACRPVAHACWYPPHLAADHQPMRWDWQIGRPAPLLRTGKRAVDIYDLDGFLTTPAEVRAIHQHWQAATLPHPRAICYLDLAWEDYRPDASPTPYGRYFPAAALGRVYFGYPQERWVDFRQLDALKPMLRERIAMCARKGFDAVELDDIDSFDPPSTTGFHLTAGDAQNFLAYAFNEIHRYGMTGLWKNSPWLSWWGRRYTDGAIVEECYTYHACFASWLRGSSQYGITCTGLRGATPCGWDDFTADATRRQPTGKWVGEAEYGADHYVCSPGQRCGYKHRFSTFCHLVYAPRYGFAAVKFDVGLDGRTFYPCPAGT
ncbi:MAG TPA: endo alpha-1,4 polygalactosaminidase [Streptosporangiaceae bacterium]